MNIENLLQSLSQIRPVFHSEADFQFALAWHIKQNIPEVDIRLEYPKVDREHVRNNKRIYLDILVLNGRIKYGIELKYKTKSLELNIGEESFNLNNQGAQDIARYDYLKDIQRLEWFKSEGIFDIGYAIFLSNDSKYWQILKNTNTVDRHFRIHEGRKITCDSNLCWTEDASEGTKRNRENNIIIKSGYDIQWYDYSRIHENLFRYTYVKIQ
jgi:hypothetical protein